MPPPGFKVMIAGAGIGGLALAIMLEQAGMDYTIFEKASGFKTLGSTIILSPQVLRVFEQLGMYNELLDIGIPLAHARYYKQNRRRCGHVDLSGYKSRYGYNCLCFGRPELMDLLLRKIPLKRILWNKHVQSLQQDQESVTIQCSDGTTYAGDILVGADGAYSAVRQSLYKSMTTNNVEIPTTDTDPLRFESFCLVGLTDDMSAELPSFDSKATVMHTVVASKTKAYNVNMIPLSHGRIGWNIMGKYLNPQKSLHYCDWESEATEYLRKDVEEIAIPIGGTLGNVMKHTRKISFVMLEDKFFSTWYSGRTALMGDACHKVLPVSGQGGNQAILDAVVLANLLQELPASSTSLDITRVFEKYYELRASSCKDIVASSRRLNNVMSKEGYFMKFIRGFSLNMPAWMHNRTNDPILSSQPILHYIPPVPARGSVKESSTLATVYPPQVTTKTSTTKKSGGCIT